MPIVYVSAAFPIDSFGTVSTFHKRRRTERPTDRPDEFYYRSLADDVMYIRRGGGGEGRVVNCSWSHDECRNCSRCCFCYCCATHVPLAEWCAPRQQCYFSSTVFVLIIFFIHHHHGSTNKTIILIITTKLSYRKDYRAMRVTTQFDNTDMVCC